MPFVHVKSLPFESSLSVKDLVAGIATDFADGTGISLEHVTVTWEFLQPWHYAVTGKAAASQQSGSYPVLIDLLAPDFHGADQIEMMLRTVAESIAGRTGLSVGNVFINYRQAHSGMIFDAGDIVRW